MRATQVQRTDTPEILLASCLGVHLTRLPVRVRGGSHHEARGTSAYWPLGDLWGSRATVPGSSARYPALEDLHAQGSSEPSRLVTRSNAALSRLSMFFRGITIVPNVDKEHHCGR